MRERITVIVENGVLRPVVPLSLPEGARVEVTITDVSECPRRPSAQQSRDAIERIAAMPLEPGPEFSGRDHDTILYGEKGAR